ncbi:uncharacterized protein LOC132821469 [Hemiscyllium ocellatum]|uniref:uncharacterized protein LOC132821469 n=1 Tax=Hemiscyllium ocellatum TaxID=170820 RepID=UPI002966E92A|nr:uncharacterized protein LOC132821469 [Hemiscyllium ocellatum]
MMDALRSSHGKPLPNPDDPKLSTQDLPVRMEASKNREPTKLTYSKGQRIALGVAQVMLGLVFIAFGIPLKLSPGSFTANTGTPWWAGTSFIISGIAAIISERKPRKAVESHFTLRIILLIFSLMQLSIASAVATIGWKEIWNCSGPSQNEVYLESGPQETWQLERDENRVREKVKEDVSGPGQRYESLIREPTYTTMSALKNWRSLRSQKNI